MKKKRLTFKGSYTIEASFLMPMILTVIVIIIYLAFFLHDRAVLSSAAYISSLRGSQMINGGDIFEQVEKSSKSLIEDRMLGTEDIETDIEVNGKNISVSYTGTLKFPAGTILCKYLLSGREGIEVNAYGRATCQDAVAFVRKCRIIESVKNESGN